MNSPTQRSLNALRKEGWRCAVVERWNAYAKVRQDLFGFIDVLAMHAGRTGILGVQATSASNLASRVNKALDSDDLATWLVSGNHFVVHGWEKRKGRYVLVARTIRLNDDKLEVSEITHWPSPMKNMIHVMDELDQPLMARLARKR
jgi:hypothetical protein